MIADVFIRVVTILLYLLEGVVFVVGMSGVLLLLQLYCSDSESLVEMELTPPVVPEPAALGKKLGYFPYSAEGRRASEKLVCAICLEVFEHGEDCSEVPDCLHLFHRDCIAVWMKSKTSCPLCRRHIVPGSERVSAADDMV